MSQLICLEQAQRFLLKKHGLLGPTPFQGKEGMLAYVRQTGCVQYDPVDVCGKSHELAFLCRIKGFHREMLRQLLYEDRKLLDYWDKNMSLVLTEDWPYFEPTRQRYRNDPLSKEAIDGVAAEVRAHIQTHGPTASQQLPTQGSADWYWTRTSLARAALESLYFRGDLIIHHKRHTVRSYALAEDHLPSELLAAPNPFQDVAEQQNWMALRRIGAVGLLWNRPSDAWLCIPAFAGAARNTAFSALEKKGAIVTVQVDDPDASGRPLPPLYLRAEDQALLQACAKPFTGKKQAHFIAPLDCLMWDRKLIDALFGFAYKWEIYNPEAQRRYSYYVLPVVYGQRFAGRVEPIADRKAGVLVMKRFWPEKGFPVTAAFQAAMEAAAQKLAAFHGLPTVQWQDGFWHNEPKEVFFLKDLAKQQKRSDPS